MQWSMFTVVVAMASAGEPYQLRDADGGVTAVTLNAIPQTSWLSIVHPQRPRPDGPAGPQILFANGDRIAAELQSGDDRYLKVKTLWGLSTVPLSAMDILWVSTPPSGSSPFPDRYPWLKSPRTKDVILLANGDVLDGDLETFSDLGNLKIKVDGTSRMFPKDRIHAIAFNPALSLTKKPKGPWFRLTLRDGSRIGITKFAVSKDTLNVTTLFNETLNLPVADIIAIDRRGDDIVPLADLKTTTSEQVPYLQVTWPWTINRSVKQNPLRIQTEKGIEKFDHGVGTHPKTTLTYDLGGKYTAFDALVGMDAVTGRRGSVTVRIRIDDAEPKTWTVTASEPQRIHLDVKNAKTLTLVTDFGSAGDIQADVNWVEAILRK